MTGQNVSLAVALTLGAIALGCRSTESGRSSIRVVGCTPAEEDAIRLQEWRVLRAMEDVVVRYGLEGLDVDVVIEQEGGLGETRPEVDLILDVTGARVSIHRALLLDDPPAGDDVLVGLFAHELAHALHYSRMSRADLLVFAERYVRFFEDPTGSLRPWAAAYEQLTDMTAIAHGYAEPLQAQKRASALNVARHHPKKVWDFYLTEDEIADLGADRERLRERMERAARTVDLASVDRFVEDLLAIDD
ncbi:MAG: hypothetical protein AAGB93_08175 [Planctomycetota bacterium]